MTSGIDPLRIVLAILVVGGILALVPFLIHRLKGAGPTGPGKSGVPEVVAQRSLDLRHRLVVVRYRGCEHLIVLGGSMPVALQPMQAVPLPGEALPGEVLP